MANPIPLAFVHHANQYLITNGYLKRSGMDDAVGGADANTGYLEIFELHRAHGVPFNLHVSGTLLEAALWYRPDFIESVKTLVKEGVVELIGSSYAQNIMRFFSHEHNVRQLNEELELFAAHLDVDPKTIKVFWPPERVWDTEKLAPVLRDERLINGGYDYVLLDDRLIYPQGEGPGQRKRFDHDKKPHLETFSPYEIDGGEGLVALPISRDMRWGIPPRDGQMLRDVKDLLHWLGRHKDEAAGDVIAVYGDDLEKAAGIGGWDRMGPVQLEALLLLIRLHEEFVPVKLGEWAPTARLAGAHSAEVGTFIEMCNHFGAGEGYEKWFFNPLWEPYREIFDRAEATVLERGAAGADASLMDLASKQLLAASWETAWNTPSSGVHGDPNNAGVPSPWAKAMASHTRHARVTAEAAHWMKHKDGAAHAYLRDIDDDGEEELILKNDRLFAVIAPQWGGRLVYLFSIDGERGRMVVGNPCDDWNWMEELNKYMEIPANHPGALTELGFEHDRYDTVVERAKGGDVEVRLDNVAADSDARGLRKTFRLAADSDEIEIAYVLPAGLEAPTIECGVSPDYLSLLRHGPGSLETSLLPSGRWCATNDGVRVWLRGDRDLEAVGEREFGHGHALRFQAPADAFTVYIGSHQEAN